MRRWLHLFEGNHEKLLCALIWAEDLRCFMFPKKSNCIELYYAVPNWNCENVTSKIVIFIGSDALLASFIRRKPWKIAVCVDLSRGFKMFYVSEKLKLHWAVLSCIELHSSALNCIESHWAALSCTEFWRFIVERALSKTWAYSMIFQTALSCIELHSSALNCIELHWAASSCTEFWRFIVERALCKT